MNLFSDLGKFLETRLEEFLQSNPNLELQYLLEQLQEQEQKALKNIKGGLTDNLGIKVNLKPVQATNWKGRLRKSSKWDLAYTRMVVEEGKGLGAYYSKNGSFNKYSTKYKNNLVDELLKGQKENMLNPQQVNQIGRQLMQVLSDDVASIFLWSLNSYCVYNKSIMPPDNEKYINYYNFFTEPHNWKIY